MTDFIDFVGNDFFGSHQDTIREHCVENPNIRYRIDYLDIMTKSSFWCFVIICLMFTNKKNKNHIFF